MKFFTFLICVPKKCWLYNKIENTKEKSIVNWHIPTYLLSNKEGNLNKNTQVIRVFAKLIPLVCSVCEEVGVWPLEFQVCEKSECDCCTFDMRWDEQANNIAASYLASYKSRRKKLKERNNYTLGTFRVMILAFLLST